MGTPFLLQVTVLTGPPLETQDTVCKEGLNISSLVLREPMQTRVYHLNNQINQETHLHLHCHKRLHNEARLYCYWQL